jgi:hypothetical protein
MAKSENKVPMYLAIGLLALVIGIGAGSALFPQTEVITKEIPVEVEKEVVVTETEAFDYSTMMDLCPTCESTEATVEVITPVDQIDEAWNYVSDNWKDGDDVTTSEEDFDEIFEVCGGEDYDLDEIEWDLEDECRYIIQDFDKNKYKLVFWVEGEYDNECENNFKIEVEYYKERDPQYTIELL